MEKEFGFVAYAVPHDIWMNLPQELSKIGFAELQKECASAIENLNQMVYLQEAGLSVKEITTAFIENEAKKYDEQGHAYQFLMEIFAQFVGKKLDNTYWMPCHLDYEWIEMMQTFFDTDFPFELPENDDYTFMGLYFPHPQIPQFLAAEVAPAQVIKWLVPKDTPEFQEKAVNQLMGWFEEAKDLNCDVVLFIEALTQ